MSDHVAEAMREIQGEMAKLQSLLDSLGAWQASHTPIRATGPDVRSPQPEAAPVKRKYTQKPKKEKPAKGGGDNTHSREGKLIVAMRTEAARLKKFTRSELRAGIEAGFPHLAAQQLYGIGGNLMLMLERGELKRTGTGDAAIYTVEALLGMAATAPAVRKSHPIMAPSAKEKDYQALRGTINVPRDTDEGGGE